MEIISKRLRQLRAEQQKTQLDVAKAIGIADAAYRKYELGSRSPGAEKLLLLADYFNVSADYLLGRTDKP